MFSIEVEFSMYLSSANTVVITGKRNGVLKGNVLVDLEDMNKKYEVKTVVFMDYKEASKVKDKITLNLKVGNYKAEDLIGKKLISIDN